MTDIHSDGKIHRLIQGIVYIFLAAMLALTWRTVPIWASDNHAMGSTGTESTYTTNSDEQVTIPKVSSDGSRIYDYASLFSENEERTLTDRKEKAERAQKAQFIILTLTSSQIPEDVEGGTETTEKYAEQFYIDNDFSDDTVLLTVDMNNRVLWVTGHGKYAGDKFVSYTKKIYERINEAASDGDYMKAAETFISMMADYRNVAAAIRPTGVSLIVSVIVTLVVMIILFSMQASAAPSERNAPQIPTKDYRVTAHDVMYTGTHRTVRHIPKNNSGSGGDFTGGTSSGGGFSGGGGNFSGGGGHF